MVGFELRWVFIRERGVMRVIELIGIEKNECSFCKDYFFYVSLFRAEFSERVLIDIG